MGSFIRKIPLIGLACVLLVCILILGAYGYVQSRTDSVQSTGKLSPGEPNQPKTLDEAQKRVKFTIYRPRHKPAGFKKQGSLVLFGNDNYLRINYNTEGTPLTKEQGTIQINEAKATDSQVRGHLREFLLVEDKNISGLEELDICGTIGYEGLAFNSPQKLVFVKDKTRILITVFPTPLAERELLRVACSMQPILAPE